MSETEIRSLKSSVDKLSREFTKMESQIEAFRTEIITAIKGDTLGNEGIVGRIVRLETNQESIRQRVERYDADRRKLIASILAASGGVSGIVSYFL